MTNIHNTSISVSSAKQKYDMRERYGKGPRRLNEDL